MNILLSLAGFLIALYISHKKQKRNQPFICPLRGNCSAVIHSNYAKCFGISVEKLGLVYYGLLVVGYSVLLIDPSRKEALAIPLTSLSVIAVFFSAYLTWIQLFCLRKLCTWCLISALLTCVIFLLSLHLFVWS